ncbi:MAG: energy transducer TonB [Terriglobales bacterium]
MPSQAARPAPAPPPPDILPTLFGAGYGTYAVRKDTFILSFLLHALGVIVLVTSGVYITSHRKEIKQHVVAVLTDYSPIALPPAPDEAGGGGGGGDRDKLEASKGSPPKFAREQFSPPAIVIRNSAPKLPVEPTVVGPPQLHLPNLGQLGDPLSNILGSPSSGPGSGSGIGSGSGGGVGPGYGPGVGPGHGGGIGGGAYRVGGGVSPPRVIEDPNPEFSEEARKAKYQGTVILWLIVGVDGRAHDIRIQRSIGMGLDEKAIEAVRRWRFEPGRKDGHPVPVQINVEVNFRLY